MKIFLVFLLFFGVAWASLTCDCGRRNAGRIVGGKETKKNEYPWMIAIRTRFNSFTFCGGAILTPWHIVTAAHCVWTRPASELTVIVGAHDVNDVLEKTRKLHTIDQVIMHPSYSNITQDNDIAILVTSTEIKFNDAVGPTCMPNKLMGREMADQMVKALGWGRYDPKKPNMDYYKRLREVDLRIINHKDCNPTQVCTYSPGKDVCMGDSGGPLSWVDPAVNRFTLTAVVSYGPEDCGNSRSPGVNTNVSYYRDWINQVVSSTKPGSKTCYRV